MNEKEKKRDRALEILGEMVEKTGVNVVNEACVVTFPNDEKFKNFSVTMLAQAALIKLKLKGYEIAQFGPVLYDTVTREGEIQGIAGLSLPDSKVSGFMCLVREIKQD